MTVRDVQAQNASLNNDYGATCGPNAPAEHELALFFGDPLQDGVELDIADCPGYYRMTIEQADWPAAVDGSKELLLQLYAPTGEWQTAATHWALIAAGEVVWDVGQLAEPLVITGAGDGPQILISIFYDTNLLEVA